jgi:hypothetical protein
LIDLLAISLICWLTVAGKIIGARKSKTNMDTTAIPENLTIRSAIRLALFKTDRDVAARNLMKNHESS